MHIYILTVPGLSYSTWDLQSSLKHARFLIAACEIQFSDQGLNLGSRAQSLSRWTIGKCLLLYL